MTEDPDAEIRASVGAHQDLGPAYDDAVAEGLVERIGAEIDKRIDARLGWLAVAPPGTIVAPGAGAVPGTGGSGGSSGAPGVQEAAGVQGVLGMQGTLGDQGVAVPPEYQGYPTPAGYPPAGYPPPGYPAAGYPPPGYPAAGYQAAGYPAADHPGYQGFPGYQPPMLPPGYQGPVPRVPPLPRSQGQRSVAMTIIALGSMTLGVAATAIVSHASNHAGQAFMVLLIWAAIAIINVAYARRR